MNWLDDLAIEDLPPKYQEMARVIAEVAPEVAYRVTIKLAEHFGKDGFYFTSIDRLITRKKQEYIVKNFNGGNHEELARACDFSPRWVYKILETVNNKNDWQIDMFEGGDR